MNQEMKDKNSYEKLIKDRMQENFSTKFWKKQKIMASKTILTIIFILQVSLKNKRNNKI